MPQLPLASVVLHSTVMIGAPDHGPGSAAEHDGGAAEPERANAEEVRSVEDIIAVLAEEGGERAQSIVAAAFGSA